MEESLTSLFRTGISAVDPEFLVQDCISFESSSFSVHSFQQKFSSEFIFDGTGKLYFIAFGKASSKMASAVLKLLGDKLHSGVIIMPESERQSHPNFPSNFQCFYGAKGNLPDQNAYEGAKAAVKLIEEMNSDDLLVVAISGGGSALFPYPLEGVDFSEMVSIIDRLSKAGATINELNTVRKRLSKVKGGRLAQMCPCTLVSLILSDVVEDPLDVIASGPTVPNLDLPAAALDVVEKYHIDVSSSVRKVLEAPSVVLGNLNRVHNFLVGSNWNALKKIKEEASLKNMISLVISRSIQGEARKIGTAFCHLLIDLVKIETTCSFRITDEISQLLEDELDVSASLTCTLDRLSRMSQLGGKSFVVIAGGETTVNVTGNGVGGRNQECGLGFLLEVAKSMKRDPAFFQQFEAAFLCSGTDGQDGPTDVAGVVVTTHLADNMDIEAAERALANNDSFTFFANLEGGRSFIKTGPTGTNIMDVMMLMIRPIRKELACHGGDSK